MKRIIRNECGTNFIIHDGKLLGSLDIIINNSEDNEEYISINEKENIGNNYWYISLYSPEYLYISKDKMTQEEREEFISIISKNWNTILNMIENGCNELCGEDRYKCKHYNNRNLSHLTQPDYSLL